MCGFSSTDISFFHPIIENSTVSIDLPLLKGSTSFNTITTLSNLMVHRRRDITNQKYRAQEKEVSLERKVKSGGCFYR